jgi:hypothetical protein
MKVFKLLVYIVLAYGLGFVLWHFLPEDRSSQIIQAIYITVSTLGGLVFYFYLYKNRTLPTRASKIRTYGFLDVLGLAFWIPALVTSPMLADSPNSDVNQVYFFIFLVILALPLTICCFIMARIYSRKSEEDWVLFFLKVPLFYAVFCIVIITLVSSL